MTLTQLILWSKCVVINASNEIQLTCAYFSDNNIGDEGTCALAESLKQNMSLTYLNLSSM